MALNKTMNRRTFVGGALAASALTALAACGKNNAATSGGNAGGTLKFYIADPVAIDPYNTMESEGTQVEHILFDTLTGYDWKKQEVVPKAAESWTVNETGDVFTFKLVQGAKFHNGDPVNAASFKRGWERILDPNMATPSTIGYHLFPIKGAKEMQAGDAKSLEGVVAVDDYTLQVTLTAPMPDFLTVLAHPALAPVPQAALDDPASFLVAPIGNGPFKMDGKWVSGQFINVVRFDDYYGTKATIDGVNFSIQKDPDTAFKEFEAGSMDFCQIPSGRVNEMKQKYGESSDGFTVTPQKQVLTGVETSVYYIALNMNDPVVSNPVVRRAMSLAIDRQTICDTLFEGTRVPADCIIPRSIDDNAANAWADCKYDPEAAKKLVDDNGLAGTEITLSYNSGGGHEDIMTTVQGNLEAVGFKVKQSSTESASYWPLLATDGWQVGRAGWNADYPTIDNFLYPLFYSTAENNYSKYKNPEVDSALDAARQITDENARKQAYRDINQVVSKDMPVIPVMFYAHNYVGSSKLESFYYDPQSKGDFETAKMKA